MNDDRWLVYPTMWTPPMVFRVPEEYIKLLLFIVIFFFLTFGVIGLAVSALVGWIFGAVMASRDPEFLSVWIVKLLRLQRTGQSGRNGNIYLP